MPFPRVISSTSPAAMQAHEIKLLRAAAPAVAASGRDQNHPKRPSPINHARPKAEFDKVLPWVTFALAIPANPHAAP
jgi:hypothetical protein